MQRLILLFSGLHFFFSTNAQILKAELIADGFTCSMCTNATLKQLETIPFLDSIGTDVEYTKFFLYFKQNTPLDLKLIKSKVEDAGFSVGSLVLFMNFENVTVENNLRYSIGNTTYHFIDSKSQILTGPTKVKILDKGFVSDKEHKQYMTTVTQYQGNSKEETGEIKFLFYAKII